MRSIAVCLLAGCATDPLQITLTGRFDSQGLILASGTVVPVEFGKVADTEADIYLSLAQAVQLRGTNPEGTFCSKGKTASLGQIDPQHATCEWNVYASLGGNARHDDSFAADASYLVRDRFDERVYRLRIVDDFIIDGLGEGHIATVVFDIAEIDARAR